MCGGTLGDPDPEAWVVPEKPEDVVDLELSKGHYGTHLRVWPGAASMLRFLEREAGALGLRRPGVAVAELGSGTGWLGLSLARNLPAAGSILLTDLPHCVPRLAAACDSLAQQHPKAAPASAAALDWAAFAPHERRGPLPPGAPHDGPAPEADIIIGSDLVWNAETAQLLPWALRALLLAGAPRRAPRAYYGHWDRGFRDVYAILWRELRAAGLSADLLHPRPAPAPAPAEPEADEEPWAADLFSDGAAAEETPVFAVYEISLTPLCGSQ